MTDDLVELENLLPELPDAVERRRIGENLGRTSEALQDSDRQIRRLTAVLDISRDTAFEKESSQAEAVTVLLASAGDAAKTMMEAQTVDQLREVQDSYKEFTSALSNVDRQLRSHWRRVVAHDFKPLTAIGRLLEAIDKDSKLGARLIACGQAAEQVRDSITAEALRDIILKLRRERLDLENERASATKDAEVDTFLKALAEAKATLRLATPRVRNWLDEKNALDNFVITPRP